MKNKMMKEPEPIDLPHQAIDDDLYVDRYILNKLSTEEKQRFEEHLLTCARCLEQVKFTQALRQGLMDIEPEPIAVPVPKPTLLDRFLDWIQPKTPILAPAVLCLALLPLFLGDGGSGLEPRLLSPPAAQQHARILDLKTMRGDSELEPTQGALELVFTPDTPDWVLRGSLSRQIEKVRLQLLDPGGKTLWEGESLNHHQFFAVELPAGFLKEGRHKLMVRQVTADGAVYPFAYEFNVILSP